MPELQRISLVTNATRIDEPRLEHTVPSWLRVFGERLSELVIVVDPQLPSGRIAQLHGLDHDPVAFAAQLARLVRLDPRVRVVMLPDERALAPVARTWFRRGAPLRCQNGTPILAFVYAFEQARSEIVLRADCDMLFHERGFVAEAIDVIESGRAQLVEPGRLGSDHPPTVSTRALITSVRALKHVLLPMRAHKLDPLRRIHRRLLGRPRWLALEQMLERECQRGALGHVILPEAQGFSVHVPTRADASQPGFGPRVLAIENAVLPAAQTRTWNYVSAAWDPS